VVTIRSPFCGYNTTYCVELSGEDFSCYSNKIKPFSLRECLYDHWLTNKAYLSSITMTNIYQSFTYITTRWRQKLTGIDIEQTYVTVTPCIKTWVFEIRKTLPNFITLYIENFIPSLYLRVPVSSDRQHLSYGDCLEVKGNIIRTAACCVVYESCAQRLYAHKYEQFLNLRLAWFRLVFTCLL